MSLDGVITWKWTSLMFEFCQRNCWKNLFEFHSFHAPPQNIQQKRDFQPAVIIPIEYNLMQKTSFAMLPKMLPYYMPCRGWMQPSNINSEMDENDVTTCSFSSSFFKRKTTQKWTFARRGLIHFHWFRGEYLTAHLNLEPNKWTSRRVLELCPDGAARCPLTHCQWEDWRRRSEYFDPPKRLGRDTRIHSIHSALAASVARATTAAVCVNMPPPSTSFLLLHVCLRQERVQWGAERVQEKRRYDGGAGKEGRGVMWSASTRGKRSEDASGSRLQPLINKSMTIQEKWRPDWTTEPEEKVSERAHRRNPGSI